MKVNKPGHFDTETLPKYSLHTLKRLRDKVKRIVEDLELVGGRIVGTRYEHLVDVLHRKFVRKSGDYTNNETEPEAQLRLAHTQELLRVKRVNAVRSIVDMHVSLEMNAEQLNLLCVRMSGWYEELRLGLPFLGWDGNDPVWAPVFVRSCLRTPSRQGTMYQVLLFSAAGPTAGTEWEVTRSAQFLQGRMREIGLPRYENHRSDDFGGLWYTALAASSGRGLEFEQTHVSTSQSEWNKKVYKARDGLCRGPCKPLHGKYKCQTCPVGRNKCALSRIDKGFTIKRLCVNGHAGQFRNISSPFCFQCVISGKANIKKDS